MRRKIGFRSVLFLALAFVGLAIFQNCDGGLSSLTSSLNKNSFSSLATGATERQLAAGCPAGWICPTQPILSPSTNVGAWFTVYWHAPDGSPNGTHWDAWSRYNPVAGRYSSGDPATIRREFGEMRAAGIDYVLLDDTNGISNDSGAIDANVRSVFATANGLPPGQKLPIALALGAAEYNHSPAEMTRELNYAAGFATTYGDLYFRWRGLPLVVQYGPYDVAGAVTDSIRNYRDARFTFRYAAHHVNANNPLVNAFAPEGLWGWVLQEPKLASTETIAVSPGYERFHVDKASPALDREGGNRYIRQWLFAIKNRPQNIVVASWNDFGEETHVAPSIPLTIPNPAPAFTDSYGTSTPDFYVQITSAYANLRIGLQDGVSYKDEDKAHVYRVSNGNFVYQAALPRGKPVIVLPAGTLAAIGVPAPTVVAPGATPAPTPSPAQPGEDMRTVAIYRMRLPSNGDFLFSSSLGEVRTAASLGWSDEGAPFALFSNNGAGRKAVFRCVTTTGDHFLSPAANCEGQTVEGLLGYAQQNSSATANVLVRRCFHGTTGMHLATTNSAAECNPGATGFTVEMDLGFTPR